MDNTFFDGHEELYHHAKFRKDRTTRAGCRCENVVFVFTGRMPPSGKLPVVPHRPKIRVFAQQGRLVAPIKLKLGRTDGHVGPLGCAKLRLNR